MIDTSSINRVAIAISVFMGIWATWHTYRFPLIDWIPPLYPAIFTGIIVGVISYTVWDEILLAAGNEEENSV